MTETNDQTLAQDPAKDEVSLEQEPATDRNDMPGSQVEPTVEAEPEAVAEPDVEATADAEPEAAAETEPEAAAEPDVEATADAEPEAAAETEPEAAAEPDVEATADAEPEAVTEPEIEAAVDAEPKAAAEPEIEAAVDAEPKAVAEPDVEAAAENEAEATAEVPTQPELAPSAIPFAAALEAKNPVEGKVIGWNKGGFHVASSGVTTFCPRSLMELGNRPKPPAEYVNNTYTFHVLEIKEAGRRIVLTRRPAIRSERRRALDDIRSKLASSEPITGKVASVTDFGAFIDLGGGLGGLVHRSQISRTRTGEPADLLKVGEQVEAVVLKVEKKNGKRSARISLSMKALEADPWKEIATNFAAGERFKGKVVRHSEFGLFVELAPGLDGLIHTSQLPIGKQMSAREFATGEEVEGWIVEVAPRRHRIALSLREVPADDPWTKLGKQYVEGAEVEGTVEQISRFGIFIQLEPGLTGLLPMSAVTLPDGNQAQRAYPPGRQIKVVIGSIDRKRRRLGLAPPGSQLVGTKSDYKNYRKSQKDSRNLNVMAAAFAKLRQSK